MARGLFVDDVERLARSDIEEFTSLREAAEQQMPEGWRVDYKGSETDGTLSNRSLAKAVAAFSNTFGGLVLVGLTGAPPQSPISLVGVPRKGELRTRLATIIRAGVQPPPRFRVGVVEVDGTPGAQRDVAVVQVDEGDRPPYVYMEGGKQTVVVRSNDVSTPATLAELDALYARRAALQRGSDTPPVPAYPLLDRPSARLVLQTVRPLGFLLHRAVEEEFQQAVLSTLRHEYDRSEPERGAHHVEFGTTGRGKVRRKWSLQSDGAFIFATEVLRSIYSDKTHPSRQAVLLVDVMVDLVLACTAARRMLSALDWHGQVRLTAELYIGPEEILNESSMDLDRLVLNQQSLNPEKPRSEKGVVQLVVDASELDDPASIIAKVALTNLRSLRGADIDLHRFEESLRGTLRDKRI